jgi:hypothetical protein
MEPDDGLQPKPIEYRKYRNIVNKNVVSVTTDRTFKYEYI